jgi:hypothetical protein
MMQLIQLMHPLGCHTPPFQWQGERAQGPAHCGWPRDGDGQLVQWAQVKVGHVV